jgi:epoxyqueuosine reductase
MKDEKLLQELHSKLDEEGCRGRTVSVRHLCDLREDIERNRTGGLLNEEFYQERLTHFSFTPADVLPGAESLIVVAAPQPQIKVVFTWHGESTQVIVPPTYTNETDKKVERTLSHVLNHHGYHIARASIPLKLLAVRSGLGDYGRNNICYVPGMGSFHRLVAYYSDIPCSDENWREPQMMERCQNCQACLRICPTGAIAADRFLVRAERCITFHNERPTGFPAWIDRSWHNCLVGCMRCQKVCPKNNGFLDWIQGDLAFSEEETSCILNSTSVDRFPPETAKKLEQLNLLEDSLLLGRNLGMLLGKQASVST